MNDQSEIRHDPSGQRFQLELDGQLAELVYHRAPDGRMVIDHTGVPQAIGGRGLAGRLVQAAFDHARSQGWKVVPACSYAAAWIARHPDYADLVGE